MDALTPQPLQQQRRKNGFEASCENCRRAKARCDHNMPCERCVRQRKQCLFQVAPMSQTGKAGNRLNDARPASVSFAPKRSATSPLREVKRASSVVTKSPGTPVVNPLTLASGGVIGYSRRPASFRVGYMGSTGFGAILKENKTASLWENPDGQAVDHTHGPLRTEQGPGPAFGRAILAWLPDQRLLNQVIDFIASQGISRIFGDRCTLRYFSQELWRTYGSLLREPPESVVHDKVSEAITESTRRPHIVPASNEDWLDSICGSNTRWEGIGELFVAVGSAAFFVPTHDSLCKELVPDNTSKKAFACTMLECADACCMLSDEVSCQSSLSQVMLLADIVGLQSELGGDTSSELWKRIGALSAAITDLGLHLRPSEAESQSALYRDTRSCVFLNAFNIDKAVATFVGRPPCLSARFVSAILPIDVSPEELFEESSAFEFEKGLDARGWNLDNKIWPATGRRANFIIGMLRDEILELSLSPNPPRDLSGRINDLRYRLDNAINELPTIFHSRFDKTLIMEHDKADVAHIAHVQLMHMQNIFLLERIQHPKRDEQRLLETARSSLAMVVLIWSERDRYPSYRDVIHWYICCYGIPASSALAIDLWLQTFTPLANITSPHRAVVIQNLSVFVACLEWVSPDDGNYVLCWRVAKMIQNVLERALAPGPDSMPAPSTNDFDLTDINLADLPAFGQDWENFFDASSSGWTEAMQY